MSENTPVAVSADEPQPVNPTGAATPAEAAANEITPALFSPAWYDSAIAAQGEIVNQALAHYHESLGALKTMLQLRALAAQGEAVEDSHVRDPRDQ